MPPPALPPKPKTQKAMLTDALRNQANLIHDETDANGDSQTKGQALAALMWKEALGWTEEKRDDRGNLQKIVHPPILSIQTAIFERLEGKVMPTAEPGGGGIRAADKVRDLAKGRLNDIAKKALDAKSVQPTS